MRDNTVRFIDNKTVSVDGYRINYKLKRFISANALLAIAGTNGCHGGDSGHGCRTYIMIEDLAGTDIRPRVIEKVLGQGNGGIEIVLGGDCELDTIIDAFRFVADTLEDQRN